MTAEAGAVVTAQNMTPLTTWISGGSDSWTLPSLTTARGSRKSRGAGIPLCGVMCTCFLASQGGKDKDFTPGSNTFWYQSHLASGPFPVSWAPLSPCQHSLDQRAPNGALSSSLCGNHGCLSVPGAMTPFQTQSSSSAWPPRDMKRYRARLGLLASWPGVREDSNPCSIDAGPEVLDLTSGWKIPFLATPGTGEPWHGIRGFTIRGTLYPKLVQTGHTGYSGILCLLPSK